MEIPRPPAMTLRQLESIGQALGARAAEESPTHPSTRDAVDLYREVLRLLEEVRRLEERA